MRKVCEWEHVGTGNFFSEYECQVCFIGVIIDAEDSLSDLANMGVCGIDKLPPIGVSLKGRERRESSA